MTATLTITPEILDEMPNLWTKLGLRPAGRRYCQQAAALLTVRELAASVVLLERATTRLVEQAEDTGVAPRCLRAVDDVRYIITVAFQTRTGR